MATSSKKLKPKHRNAKKVAMDEGTSESNMTSIATSEVEDDCEVRENKAAVTTTEGDMKQTKLKATESLFISGDRKDGRQRLKLKGKEAQEPNN